jgi:restriction system protein
MLGMGLVYVLGALVLVAVPPLVWVVRRLSEEQRMERAGLGNLRLLTDGKFDDYVEGLFEGLGYLIAEAGGRESLGVDWILTDPRGNRTALQTRRWRQDVGPEAIEQIVGGAVYHRCDDRLVITTESFTREARRLGKQTGTRLWTLNELAGARESPRTGTPAPSLLQRPPAPETAAAPETRQPAAPLDRAVDLVAASSQSEAQIRCPRCGKTMVRRSVNGQPVLVCQEFPRCTGARVETGPLTNHSNRA